MGGVIQAEAIDGHVARHADLRDQEVSHRELEGRVIIDDHQRGRVLTAQRQAAGGVGQGEVHRLVPLHQRVVGQGDGEGPREQAGGEGERPVGAEEIHAIDRAAVADHVVHRHRAAGVAAAADGDGHHAGALQGAEGGEVELNGAVIVRQIDGGRLRRPRLAPGHAGQGEHDGLLELLRRVINRLNHHESRVGASRDDDLIGGQQAAIGAQHVVRAARARAGDVEVHRDRRRRAADAGYLEGAIIRCPRGRHRHRGGIVVNDRVGVRLINIEGVVVRVREDLRREITAQVNPAGRIQRQGPHPGIRIVGAVHGDVPASDSADAPKELKRRVGAELGEVATHIKAAGGIPFDGADGGVRPAGVRVLAEAVDNRPRGQIEAGDAIDVTGVDCGEVTHDHHLGAGGVGGHRPHGAIDGHIGREGIHDHAARSEHHQVGHVRPVVVGEVTAHEHVARRKREDGVNLREADKPTAHRKSVVR